MMENERARILRGMPWPGVDDAMQELYAMFGQQDIQLGRSISMTDDGNPNTPSGVNINNWTEGSPVFTVNKGGGGSFSMTISGGDIIINETPPPGQGGPSQILQGGGGGSPSKGGNVFPGTVASYLGGNKYMMTAYPNGRTAGSVLIQVEQLEGDPDFPHNNGRWTLICQEKDGVYSMWIPVWGNP